MEEISTGKNVLADSRTLDDIIIGDVAAIKADVSDPSRFTRLIGAAANAGKKIHNICAIMSDSLCKYAVKAGTKILDTTTNICEYSITQSIRLGHGMRDYCRKKYAERLEALDLKRGETAEYGDVHELSEADLIQEDEAVSEPEAMQQTIRRSIPIIDGFLTDSFASQYGISRAESRTITGLALRGAWKTWKAVSIVVGSAAIVSSLLAYCYTMAPLPSSIDSKRDDSRKAIIERAVDSIGDAGYSRVKEMLISDPPKEESHFKDDSEISQICRSVAAAVDKKGDDIKRQFSEDIDKDLKLNAGITTKARGLTRKLYHEHGRAFFEGTNGTPNPGATPVIDAALDELAKEFLADIKNRPGFEQNVYDKVYGLVKPQVGLAFLQINTAPDFTNPIRYLTKPAREAAFDAIAESRDIPEQKRELEIWTAQQLEGVYGRIVQGRSSNFSPSEQKGASAVNSALLYTHEGAQEVLRQHKGELLGVVKAGYMYNRGDKIIIRAMQSGLEHTTNLVLSEWVDAEIKNANIAVNIENFRLTSDMTIEVDTQIASVIFKKMGIFPSFLSNTLSFIDTSNTYELQEFLDPSTQPSYRQLAQLADVLVREAMYQERKLVRKPGESDLVYKMRKEEWSLELNGIRTYAKRLYERAAAEIMNMHLDCPNCEDGSPKGCIAKPINIDGKQVRAPQIYHASLLRKNMRSCIDNTLDTVTPMTMSSDDAKRYDELMEEYLELREHEQKGGAFDYDD